MEKIFIEYFQITSTLLHHYMSDLDEDIEIHYVSDDERKCRQNLELETFFGHQTIKQSSESFFIF